MAGERPGQPHKPSPPPRSRLAVLLTALPREREKGDIREGQWTPVRVSLLMAPAATQRSAERGGLVVDEHATDVDVAACTADNTCPAPTSVRPSTHLPALAWLATSGMSQDQEGQATHTYLILFIIRAHCFYIARYTV